MPFVCILGEVDISYIFCFIFRDLLTFTNNLKVDVDRYKLVQKELILLVLTINALGKISTQIFCTYKHQQWMTKCPIFFTNVYKLLKHSEIFLNYSKASKYVASKFTDLAGTYLIFDWVQKVLRYADFSQFFWEMLILHKL